MAKAYKVEGMDCAHCVLTIEKGVSRLDGVRGVEVNLATEMMRVHGDVSEAVLRERVEALGYKLADSPNPTPQSSTYEPPPSGVTGFARYLLKAQDTRLALAGGGLIALGIMVALVGFGAVANALFVAATLVALYPVALSGLNNLRINRDFNINLLMTIAAVGALLIGELAEAATVVFLFAIGEALEGYTSDRARDSLRGLMALAPAQAMRLRKAHSGALLSKAGDNMISLDGLFSPPPQREEVVPVADLAVGDVILVKAGERAAMDGVVVAGESGVDQAPITGESVPVHKGPGDTIYAGTINGAGALELRVTHLAADNTLSRIIRMIEEAQSVRAPSQRLVDQFARVYTPAVTVIAAVIALVPPLLFNAPFYDLADGTHGWLYRALSLLVIACPCALVISTPVTVISAITAAARRGVLIKGGAHLEALAGIKAFAFDKTGTLTRGKPIVTTIRSIDCTTGSVCDLCDDVLALASAVERRSAHPLARAVVDAAQGRGLADAYVPAEAVETLAGRGVQGRVNGKLVTLGSHTLFELEHPHSAELCALVDAAESNGQTAMLLCDGDRVRGFIAVADEAREDSRSAVNQLRAMGSKAVMLTGDNAIVAKAVGQNVGVDDVRAGLLPEDKVNAIQSLKQQYGAVAMVGDGVNDTPALAAATVGIAMGGAGSAQALETADIALMADDLTQLPFALRLARFARRLIMQNMALSFGVKLLFVGLALAGITSLWLAILADVGVSLLVTLNGMRPLRAR
jgi:Zn2+/Cd2+-exporting ATPase